MAVPATRKEFKEYCLRKIGAPVIDLNLSDEQIDDRVDEALRFFMDYHFEGTERTFYKKQLTQTDITNQYITMPDNIIGAINIFPIGMSLSSNNLFNIRYQIALNDLYDLTSSTMVPYFLAMQHVQFLEQMLVGQQPLRYNRYVNKLHLDMDWRLANVDDYLVIEAYEVVDPEVYTKVWSDRWLTRYATALIKRQWGDNLTKYKDMNLPGGQKFNADRILDDAQKEIDKLEDLMINTYSLPVSDMVG